jgi:hypothetical protein
MGSPVPEDAGKDRLELRFARLTSVWCGAGVERLGGDWVTDSGFGRWRLLLFEAEFQALINPAHEIKIVFLL